MEYQGTFTFGVSGHLGALSSDGIPRIGNTATGIGAVFNQCDDV
jgi:hypothetical protein